MFTRLKYSAVSLGVMGVAATVTISAAFVEPWSRERSSRDTRMATSESPANHVPSIASQTGVTDPIMAQLEMAALEALGDLLAARR